jgi:hypothetical protein
MIKFLKERFFTVLLLSVIFTFSSLFWTSDVVYNQEDLNGVELGWPANFVSQNKAFSLTPPESWFPKEIGLGTPTEYPISFSFLPFLFNIVFGFAVIFSIAFVLLNLYPNSRVLSHAFSINAVVGFIIFGVFLFIFSILFLVFQEKLERGVYVPSPIIEKPTPLEPNSNINIFKNNHNVPIDFESKELGFSFKYPGKYNDVSYTVVDSTTNSTITGRVFNGAIYEKKCPPNCLREGIIFVGMTADFSDYQGGAPTDILGYIKRDGKYFIIRSEVGEIEVLSQVEEIKTATAEGILVRGYGITADSGFIWSKDALLAIFKLKESEFRTLNFFASDTSEEDFMQIMRWVNIFGYDGNKVLSTYNDDEYGFEMDYPSYLKAEVLDDQEIKMTESAGGGRFIIDRSIYFRPNDDFSRGYMYIGIYKNKGLLSLDDWLVKENSKFLENPLNARVIIDEKINVDSTDAIVVRTEDDIEAYAERRIIVLKDGILFEFSCGPRCLEDVKNRIRFN